MGELYKQPDGPGQGVITLVAVIGECHAILYGDWTQHTGAISMSILQLVPSTYLSENGYVKAKSIKEAK